MITVPMSLVHIAAASPARHFFVIFGAGMAALGLVFLLIGLLVRKTWRGFRGAARAEGKIVDFDAQLPGSGMRVGRARVSVSQQYMRGIVYMPTVEFTTADGTPVRATSHIGTNPRPGRVGDTVTVLYDPRNPKKVRVQSGKATYTCLELAFILFGGAVAALGIVILIAAH